MVCDCLTGLRTNATDSTAEDMYFNPPRQVPNGATVRVLQEMPRTSPFEEVEVVSNTQMRGFIRRKYLLPAKPNHCVECQFHWQNDTAATWTRLEMPVWEPPPATKDGTGQSWTRVPKEVQQGQLAEWSVLLNVPDAGEGTHHFGRSFFFSTGDDEDQMHVELRWDAHIECETCTLSLRSCCGGVSVFFNCISSRPVELAEDTPVITGAFRCNEMDLPHPAILPSPNALDTYCLADERIDVLSLDSSSKQWVRVQATLTLGSIDSKGSPLLHLRSDRQPSIICISQKHNENRYAITAGSTVNQTSKFMNDNKLFCFLLSSRDDDGTMSEIFFAVDTNVS